MDGLGGFVALPAWGTVALVFLVPALESCALPGVALPGQSALLTGGALAAQGRAHLGAVVAAAVLGAVLGPGIGYATGRRWGRRAFVGLPLWLLKPSAAERAQRLLLRLGGPAVALARFVAVLRTVVPVLSGMAGFPLRSFLLWNALGGSLWGIGGVTLGFLVGGAL